MPLIGDFLDVLGATLGKWSLSTKYAFKKLTGKKHVADATAVQNLSAEARREAVAETDGKGIRRGRCRTESRFRTGWRMLFLTTSPMIAGL